MEHQRLAAVRRTRSRHGPDAAAVARRSARHFHVLYQHVARLVAEKWNRNGQCSLVVGATFPQELAAVRAIVGDMPLLVPGIGAQGGDIAATVRAGRTLDGMGMMINSSRAILYAAPEPGEDYVAAARRVALATRDEINLHRA